MKVTDMVIGDAYNYKYQSERLVYVGYNFSGNGHWHQFEQIGKDDVWAELTTDDLKLIERTVK
jgi:hypothetical protein